MRLYINGTVQENKPSLTGPVRKSSIPSFLVGADPPSSKDGAFKGTIDEVRISKSARYAGDFVPERRFKPDDTTELLYHFDEKEGTTAKDSSTNERHGTIFGDTERKEGVDLTERDRTGG